MALCFHRPSTKGHFKMINTNTYTYRSLCSMEPWDCVEATDILSYRHECHSKEVNKGNRPIAGEFGEMSSSPAGLR